MCRCAPQHLRYAPFSAYGWAGSPLHVLLGESAPNAPGATWRANPFGCWVKQAVRLKPWTPPQEPWSSKSGVQRGAGRNVTTTLKRSCYNVPNPAAGTARVACQATDFPPRRSNKHFKVRVGKVRTNFGMSSTHKWSNISLKCVLIKRRTNCGPKAPLPR